MAITLKPFVRFTSFNFWLVGLEALYAFILASHRPQVTVAIFDIFLTSLNKPFEMYRELCVI